ncbi:MAG TPA: hypothetical protein VKD90_13660 [Gemmataceae bacterium]|nr:hypothetical protein [Gemmataceae bacterium]
MHPHEEALVRTFITPERRSRWLQGLASDKRRAKQVDRLNHCRDLDWRYATELPSTADVVAFLRARGAPEACYVLSSTGALDGREMPLAEAVWAAEAAGWGTLVGCVPGRLAYYYDEVGLRRMVLERAGR